MEIYTVEHWQQNWDSLISRVENGETIGVTNGTNTAAVSYTHLRAHET